MPYQVFHGSDRPFAIGVGTDRHFAQLCERVLRRPELAQRRTIRDETQRVKHREVLVAMLEEAFRERTARAVGGALPARVDSGLARARRARSAAHSRGSRARRDRGPSGDRRVRGDPQSRSRRLATPRSLARSATGAARRSSARRTRSHANLRVRGCRRGSTLRIRKNQEHEAADHHDRQHGDHDDDGAKVAPFFRVGAKARNAKNSPVAPMTMIVPPTSTTRSRIRPNSGSTLTTERPC